jgi:hypothetical protein
MKRLALAVMLAFGSVACSANEPFYFPAPAPMEVGGGMDQPTALSVTIDLPFRRPTEEQLARLQQESDRRMVQVPWLRAEDVSLSLLYTVTNLGDETGSARLEIDGASEFASYDTQALRAAGAMADPDAEEETVLALIRPKPLLLDPGQVFSGTIREDDFDEAALDLDAIGRFGATPASVLINRSEANPIGLEMIPPGYVRPALFRVQVTFSATTHMRLEFLVRVRDDASQLQRQQGEVFQPDPPAYVPMVPPP